MINLKINRLTVNCHALWTMHSKNLIQTCSGLMPYCKVLGLGLNNSAVLNSCTLTNSLGVVPHIGKLGLTLFQLIYLKFGHQLAS